MMKKLVCLLLCCLLPWLCLAETVQDQALAFLQQAGINADSVIRIGDEILIPLAGGGTAALKSTGDFDPLQLAWRFDGANDEDLALYLNHALSLLLAVEARIPADRTSLSPAEERRANGYEALIENALSLLENLGQQGLDVLLNQLAARDGIGLDSLRARLASRLLGQTVSIAVDPREGLAWYDAWLLAAQTPENSPAPDVLPGEAD